MNTRKRAYFRRKLLDNGFACEHQIFVMILLEEALTYGTSEGIDATLESIKSMVLEHAKYKLNPIPAEQLSPPE